MGKETKSLGQKDILDRFFTIPTIAKKCIELIHDLNEYDCIFFPLCC